MEIEAKVLYDLLDDELRKTLGLTGERLRSLPLRPKVVAEATAVS